MKKYKCQFCLKSFQSEKDLKKHLERIHGLTVAEMEGHTEEEQSEFVEQCLGIMDEMDKSSMETKG